MQLCCKLNAIAGVKPRNQSKRKELLKRIGGLSVPSSEQAKMKREEDEYAVTADSD